MHINEWNLLKQGAGKVDGSVYKSTLSVLPEDLGSIPNTHMAAHSYLVSKDLMAPLASTGTRFTETHTVKTHNINEEHKVNK